MTRQAGDLVALTTYALRGLATLDAGTTLEVIDPQLLRVEVTKSWGDAADDASPAHADGNPTPVVGFHLLRVETPSTQMRMRRIAHTSTM